MYVQPFGNNIIQPVPQQSLTPWGAQLDCPRPLVGVQGLGGGVSGGVGLGCAECGGTCCGAKKKTGVNGMTEDFSTWVNSFSPFTGLVVNLVMVGLAISAFKWLFLSPQSGYGARRERVVRARRGVERAGRELKQAESWGVL